MSYVLTGFVIHVIVTTVRRVKARFVSIEGRFVSNGFREISSGTVDVPLPRSVTPPCMERDPFQQSGRECACDMRLSVYSSSRVLRAQQHEWVVLVWGMEFHDGAVQYVWLVGGQ